jgi:hypothetical protein
MSVITDWMPPGYVDVSELAIQRGVNRVRDDLFEGRLQAYRWDPVAPDFDPIDPTFWLKDEAWRWLVTGEVFHDPGSFPHRILVKKEEEQKPPPATDGVYLSPFIALMLEAVRKFKINEENWAKKKELEEYFRAQKLPGGKPISVNLAKNLASYCRPPEAMSGGNSKWDKPRNRAERPSRSTKRRISRPAMRVLP